LQDRWCLVGAYRPPVDDHIGSRCLDHMDQGVVPE